jgi:Zn-dependent peptidase ImmA (M78 family)
VLADDSSLPAEERVEVARQARLALMNADAFGIFPTPVDAIMAAAKIEVIPLVIDEGYLTWLRRKAETAGRVFLSAITKLWGVLDPQARIAYIDPETPKEKLPFLKLHEGGHALLPWQSAFGHAEDCRKTLSPDIKDEFERQANVFASDALFQIDGLTRDAQDLAFGIAAVLELSRRYGASIYSTARRYVSTHERACAVMIFNALELDMERGVIATMRRVATSASFDTRFGAFAWPDWISSKEALGRLIPSNRMSRPRDFAMVDRNGMRFQFIGEAFKTSRHILILIHCSDAPTRTLVVPDRQLMLL